MNTTPIAIEAGSGNAYADLGLPDAQEMLVKAKLASKIAEIIQRQKLTQQQAAELLAMPQPKELVLSHFVLKHMEGSVSLLLHMSDH